ncbi:MAG: COX15/CtaA family protein [Hyphomicrobiaceae bacterium]
MQKAGRIAMALGVTVRSAEVRRSSHAAVRGWLACVAVLVVIMVAVGGATRLTDSGLSITEWQPIVGTLPPLSDADWQVAFDKYKQIPEYREVNDGMDLAGFKTIFWWEWAHRFLGRLIGLAFAVPLVWFWLRRRIPKGYGAGLFGLLVLGGLQGFIGWYMVQSGLTDRVDVSQYRLAMHLCLAFLILGLLTWTWARLETRRDDIYLASLPAGAALLSAAILALCFCQVALGAFVAGTKAGLVYTTWPLMDGELVPDGLYASGPWYRSMFEDHLTIQFNHRVMAYVLVVLAIVQAFRLRHTDDARVPGFALGLAVLIVLQAGLGVWTLVSVDGAIPIGLGIAHQTLAAIVFAASVLQLHSVRTAAVSDAA